MPEREVKLTPVPGFRLPALDDVVEGVTARPDEILDLDAIYYDTADLRLARSGASLRYRDPEGWTVKLPAPSGGRAARARRAHVPGRARRPARRRRSTSCARWVRTAAVHAVARLKTRRRRVELVDAGGKKVAEVVDDEVSVLDDGRITGRFRELEVEIGEDARRSRSPTRWSRGCRRPEPGPPDPDPEDRARARPARRRPARRRAARRPLARLAGARRRPRGDRGLGAAAPRARPRRPARRRPRAGAPGAGRHPAAALGPADVPLAARPGVGRGARGTS